MTAAEALANPSSLGTDLEQSNQAIAAKLDNVTIRSGADAQQAVLDRQDLGDRAKRVAEFFRPIKEAAHRAHKAVCDRENEVLGPILRVDRILRDALAAFKSEQDRQRREEEQRLAAQRREEEQARLATEAAALESAGEAQLAAAVLEQAVTLPVPVVVVPDATKAVEGLKFRTEWKWRYVGNDADRAHAIVPREFMVVDEKKVGAYVRSMKATAKIPGIEVYTEQVPVR